jgi:hypothetical protein
MSGTFALAREPCSATVNIETSNVVESTGVINGDDSDSVEIEPRGGKVCKLGSVATGGLDGVGDRVMGGKVDVVLAGEGALEILVSLASCFFGFTTES